MVNEIFDTNNRKEVIHRFLGKYSNGDNGMFLSPSCEYSNGINRLQESLKGTFINQTILQEASSDFEIATKTSKGKSRLLAYLGKIVCFYVTDNLFAIKSVVGVVRNLEPMIPVNIPVEVNMKGVGQNIVKGVGTVAGLTISLTPWRMAGVALIQSMKSWRTEDAFPVNRPLNEGFYRLRDEIVSVDYEKLHGILR